MEQHDERLARQAIDEVDVDKIAVRRVPAFAPIRDCRFADQGSRIDGL
jgi:hypothetical protein